MKYAFIFLLVIGLSPLYCQDEIYTDSQDTLYITYYEDYAYVTNQYGEEFNVKWSSDWQSEGFRMFADFKAAPVVEWKPEDYLIGAEKFYIHYGDLDWDIIGMYKGTKIYLMWTKFDPIHNNRVTLAWDSYLFQGLIDHQNGDQHYATRIYKGTQGLKDLYERFKTLTRRM
jgi:hypothetical protein